MARPGNLTLPWSGEYFEWGENATGAGLLDAAAALVIGANGGDMHPAQVEAALRASADDFGKPGRIPTTGMVA